MKHYTCLSAMISEPYGILLQTSTFRQTYLVVYLDSSTTRKDLYKPEEESPVL